jgi:hypothetical protein
VSDGWSFIHRYVEPARLDRSAGMSPGRTITNGRSSCLEEDLNVAEPDRGSGPARRRADVCHQLAPSSAETTGPPPGRTRRQAQRDSHPGAAHVITGRHEADAPMPGPDVGRVTRGCRGPSEGSPPGERCCAPGPLRQSFARAATTRDARRDRARVARGTSTVHPGPPGLCALYRCAGSTGDFGPDIGQGNA